MKEIRATIMTNPGLLDSEWTMPETYRYLLELETPLSQEQVKLLCAFAANLRGSTFAPCYEYQREFTYCMPLIEEEK